MKKYRWLTVIFTILFLISLSCSISYADGSGEGNIDNGGGGMGSGSGQNYWNTNDEGVRITIIQDSDQTPISVSIDLTNKTPLTPLFTLENIAKYIIEVVTCLLQLMEVMYRSILKRHCRY